MPAWVWFLLAPAAAVALLLVPGVAEAVGRAARAVAPPAPPSPATELTPEVAAARDEYLAAERQLRKLEKRGRRQRGTA